jgi:hypothetical protein
MAWSCRKPPPLGLASILDHWLRLPGRREDRFDFFLPDLGLLIDLDPAWTHGSSDSLVRDTAKTEAGLAAGLDMERIRERGLPALPLSGRMHYEAGPGLDPGQWAEAVGQVLRRRGLPWKDLDPAQVRAALTEASRMWQEVVARPETSAMDVAPHLAKEFVGNITNPGRGLDQMPPGCNDECAWRCSAPDCGFEWEVPLYTRTLSGRECRMCGLTRMCDHPTIG